MLNCHNATSLMSQEQERPLTLQERLALGVHIAMCSGCRHFSKQMPALRLLSRSYAARAGVDVDDTDDSKAP